MNLIMKKYFGIFAIPLFLLLLAGCGGTQKTTADKRASIWEMEPREISQIEQLESTARLIEAGKQKALGNYAEALLLYAEAAKIDPKNSAAFYQLAKLHAQQGFMRDAEILANIAVGLDPDNKFFSMVLADIYFAQNKNEEGLKIQKKLAERYPTDLDVQISKLSTLLYMEQFEEAISIFEHIENISGFNNEMSVQKQRVLLQMNQPARALEEARRLVSYFPDDVVYLELLADLYEENDQPEMAYATYKRMLEAHPGHPMAHLLLSDYYRNNDQHQQSFDQLEKAFRSDQLGADGKTRIMVSYYFLSEDDEMYLKQAFRLADILIEVHPDKAQVFAVYGDFLLREDKIEQARDMYLKATELDPGELGFWQQLLSVELRLNDYESLLVNSSEALEYFFEQPLLYFFNGLAHFYLENYDRAISAFTYGKELSFDQPDLKSQFLTLLADTYFRLDDYQRSYQHYEMALEINPDDAYALNNYSYYMSTQSHDLERALAMSARSLEIQPDNSSFQDTFGWIKYKMGDYQEAKVWIRKSLDNSEEPSAVVLEHYGDVLYKLGQKEQALTYWKKALNVKKEQDRDEGVSEFLEQKVKEGKLIE